jgi:Protein of unknown function (DUF3341)
MADDAAPGSGTMTAAAPTARPGPRIYGLMAEFTKPGDILHAAEKVRDAGFKWWDCHTPFPVHGLDQAMGIKATILPVIVFFGGLTGTLIALGLQMFTNSFSFELWVPPTWVRGYNFFISGKPPVSLPAFIPVTFELTVLLAALTTVGCVLVLNNLPRLYHPCFKSLKFARATDDRFFLVIEARDPKFSRSRTEELLRSLNPTSIEALEA